MRNKSTFHFQKFLSFWISGLEASRHSCSHKPAAETDAEDKLPFPDHHLAAGTRPHPVFSQKGEETEFKEFPSGSSSQPLFAGYGHLSVDLKTCPGLGGVRGSPQNSIGMPGVQFYGRRRKYWNFHSE